MERLQSDTDSSSKIKGNWKKSYLNFQITHWFVISNINCEASNDHLPFAVAVAAELCVPHSADVCSGHSCVYKARSENEMYT